MKGLIQSGRAVSRAAAALLCALGIAVAGTAPAAAQGKATLFAYVGTGIKGPVSELCSLYEARTGTKIEMTFNNSGSLVGQLKLNKSGDLFMPGSLSFVEAAAKDGFIAATSKPMGYHVPVIVVPKGNPARIAGVADLGRSGVRLVMPDRKATALGKSAAVIFQKAGIAAGADVNTVASMESPQKVVAALILGQGDAGIADYGSAAGNADKLDFIDIDPSLNIIDDLPCAVLSCGSNRDEAMKFLAFAEAEGPAIFAKHGFKTTK